MYGEDPTIKDFSVKIHGGGTFSDYTVKSKWTHHNSTSSCDHFDSTLEKISDEKWEEQETLVVADTRNIELAQTPHCTFINRECLDLSDRTIQGKVQLHKELENEKHKNLIHNLSKENGFFFFYEGKSRISQALALVVREFALKYHLEVVAITVDGVLLEIFPESKLDNGVSQQFAIEIFPALYLINPKTKSALPVAYGLVSVDQIERNIALQFDLTD